ncbi:putative transposase [Cytobacillus oceanisediminis]|uniref:Putative transposase n=1 Tax=Cytobacillus oceanisediminis TaxID=665099 RepID=A0A2V3A1G0_9BACI|nr:Mu transposase C-terminal domain-containing protein [Cytobacillus oceanisediminis]PWW30562.1 putative transposase [Cytobacillus oceanisediminis]
MYKISIGRGTRFLLNGRSYEVTRKIDKDSFEAEDLSFEGVKEKFTRRDLLIKLEMGQLQFSVKGKNTSKKGKKPSEETIISADFDDFHMLPEKVKEEALFRKEVIDPLIGLNVKSLSKYVDQREKELAKEGISVSRASIYRWLKAYKDSDGSIHSLVSSAHKCGSKEMKLHKEVELIIDQVIDELYLTREKTLQKSIHTIVFFKIDEVNKERARRGVELLKHPSLSTVRRRIYHREAFEVAKARKGTQYARSKYGQVQRNEKPRYPLQRVEVDHTRLDLFVVDDKNRLPIGRPWLTSVLDVFTGYPLGFYIGFEPPSYTSVMHALNHAFSTKFYMKDKYPDIENEWLAYGLPELLVVDNGKEFRSKHLKDVCIELDIELYHCPVKVPWYKGAVERYFRTINQSLIHEIPGTTFSNVIEKRDYNPKKNAIIGFNKFLHIFHKWVVDIYTKEYHKGVKGIPAEIWSTAFERVPDPLVPSTKLNWSIILMKLGSGTIQRTGIRDRYLFYQSKDLMKLQRELRKQGLPNQVKYKFDPTDLSKIYVYDEMNRNYIEVPCTDQEYTEGLNEYSHRAVIKKLNADQKKVDMHQLAAAKAELLRMVQEEKHKTLKSQQQAARISGVGSNEEWQEPAAHKEKKVSEETVTIVKANESHNQTSSEDLVKVKPNHHKAKSAKEQAIEDFDDIDLSKWGFIS